MAFNRLDDFLMFVFNFGQFAAVSVPMENIAFHFSAIASKFLNGIFCTDLNIGGIFLSRYFSFGKLPPLAVSF